MRQVLWLANVRILLGLNHLLAEHPWLYQAGIFLTEEGADLALLATAIWLWFWPVNRSFGRTESRARLLVLGMAGISAYIVTRLIALNVDWDRPFMTYLPVRGTPGAFEGLRTFGTFPSDHAALLGALPVAFAYWSRRLALVWTGLALFLMLLRVAVGYHYPIDMVVGALIGCLFAFAAMEIYDGSRAMHGVATTVASGFSRPPYAYALYGALVLVGIEFSMHFTHILWAILTIQALIA